MILTRSTRLEVYPLNQSNRTKSNLTIYFEIQYKSSPRLISHQVNLPDRVRFNIYGLNSTQRFLIPSIEKKNTNLEDHSAIQKKFHLARCHHTDCS